MSFFLIQKKTWTQLEEYYDILTGWGHRVVAKATAKECV